MELPGVTPEEAARRLSRVTAAGVGVFRRKGLQLSGFVTDTGFTVALPGFGYPGLRAEGTIEETADGCRVELAVGVPAMTRRIWRITLGMAGLAVMGGALVIGGPWPMVGMWLGVSVPLFIGYGALQSWLLGRARKKTPELAALVFELLGG
ncbi:MAG: hypothetical protein GY913_13835 [Proteobacteria bacterium]|nr:hypothetical protein [Pseudomonadota bacterium]MCP4917989.1 hypothetical protein [Pseudomonadota bacterium]